MMSVYLTQYSASQKLFIKLMAGGAENAIMLEISPKFFAI